MHWVVSLIAVLGVGSIVAALFGWAIAIASHRQAWINALRDDLATFLRELQATHYAIGDLFAGATPEAEQRKREARLAILFTYYRIVLRLNITEAPHIELKRRLDELMRVEDRVPDQEKLNGLIDLARRVLKREWAVTKYGPLTDLALWAKRLGRRPAASERISESPTE